MDECHKPAPKSECKLVKLGTGENCHNYYRIEISYGTNEKQSHGFLGKLLRHKKAGAVKCQPNTVFGAACGVGTFNVKKKSYEKCPTGSMGAEEFQHILQAVVLYRALYQRERRVPVLVDVCVGNR